MTNPTPELPTSTHAGLGYAAPYRKNTDYGHLFSLPAMPDPGTPVLAQLAASMIDTEAPSTAVGTAWPAAGGSGDNLDVPAGYTYLGQFIDHDITFDPVSTLTGTEPGTLTDLRTARFDLDSLYGRGMDDQPYLYDQNSPGKLLITPHSSEPGAFDVPRNTQGRALIGDPRNDVHLIISQLHLLFARFHNARVTAHTAQGMSAREAFAAAQQDVLWHYQWLVTHDYLDHIVGSAQRSLVLSDAVLAAAGQQGTPARAQLAHYKLRENGEAWIPYEFSVAAFRFGHSQVRPTYKLNPTLTPLPIFDPTTGNDLHGSRERPPGWTVDWTLFFAINPSVTPQPSRRIDTKIASALSTLPPSVVSDNGPVALPQRNLMRGVALGLPSGQAVAEQLGVTPYAGTLTDPSGVRITLPDPAPLWFYCLAEAQMQGGTHLGPVGGAIVTEVFVGILKADPDSYLNRNPLWSPTLGATPGNFTMADIVTIAASA